MSGNRDVLCLDCFYPVICIILYTESLSHHKKRYTCIDTLRPILMLMKQHDVIHFHGDNGFDDTTFSFLASLGYVKSKPMYEMIVIIVDTTMT